MFGKRAIGQIKETVRRVLVNPQDGRRPVPGLDFSQRLDRERVKNASEEAVPAFGIMQIVAWGTENEGHYIVNKPNGDDEPIGFLLNGREEIAADDFGSGAWITIRPLPALIDATAMALNDECGPVADSWELSSDGRGFRLISEEIGDTPQRAYIYKPLFATRAVAEIEFFESSSMGPRGWYVEYTDAPGVWVLKIPAVWGYCPGSSGGGGTSCDLEAYDPGIGWDLTGAEGIYAETYTNLGSTVPPAAMECGEWVQVSGPGVTAPTDQYAWVNECCGVKAYGAEETP